MSDCPYCGAGHVRHEHQGGNAEPSPGDISICYECTGVSVFQKDLTLAKWPPAKRLPLEVLESLATLRATKSRPKQVTN